VTTKRIYRALLRFYPVGYRANFGTEMLDAFEKAAEDARALGRAVFLRFVLTEFAGLAMAACAEWISKLAGRTVYMPNPAVAGEGSLPREVFEAKRRVAMLTGGMTRAIAARDFKRARDYSYEDRAARENLQRISDRYNIRPEES